MAIKELDRLRALANFAEQVCSLADNENEARERINQMINRAEEDIRTKSLEIQLQQSHVALLKQLEKFMQPQAAEQSASTERFRLNDTEHASPRAIAADGQQQQH